MGLDSSAADDGVLCCDDSRPYFASGTADITGHSWSVSGVEASSGLEAAFIYGNSYHLFPVSVARLPGLKTLKFFGNEVELIPSCEEDAGGELMAGLESLQVNFSSPQISGSAVRKMSSLRELELSKVPRRHPALSILSDIAGLKCLTKLTIRHFAIRYLPLEIFSLKKLEELDLSFNKLKTLPKYISELTALKSLKVRNNKLMELPSEVSLMGCLQSLDLSYNKLSSLVPLELTSMLTLQYLNLKFNKITYSFHIPPWICCDMRGNKKYVSKHENILSIGDRTADSLAVRSYPNHSCGSDCNIGSSFYDASKGRISKTKKSWKRSDSLQQKAREERLKCSRNRILEDDNSVVINMSEDDSSFLDAGNKVQEVFSDEECSTQSKSSCDLEDQLCCEDFFHSEKDNNILSHDYYGNGMITSRASSCVTADTPCLDKGYDFEDELSSDTASSVCSSNLVGTVGEPTKADKSLSSAKRHHDYDSNPKPTKFLKPVDEQSNASFKYSSESFCSIYDRLPDGFYDAGRDRPFMPIQDYELIIGQESREVILLDREKDDELDLIAQSAQLLLSTLRSPGLTDAEDVVDDFRRVTVLALFVSDCFGGCDRSASLMRTRRSVVCLDKAQPFICTCACGNPFDVANALRTTGGLVGHLDFSNLCEQSLKLIKKRHNSSIVHIGSMHFGICRHRAVLMKYLCDRADPPIQCELVRGYLDFEPHAWNIVLAKRGNSLIRMIVDTCYPTNIREEMDPEYFCRYIPLSRFCYMKDQNGSPSLSSFPTITKVKEIKRTQSCLVYHCKIGTLDAAVKVHQLSSTNNEEIRNFKHKFLGEVRMLGALRNQNCIVDYYGHQLSSKWINGKCMLQAVIMMQYMEVGSLKGYIDKLFREGCMHVPLGLAMRIARDVASALVELHSKYIIHRDIKSENILIDLDSKRSDGVPSVKLSDFDQSVPLHALLHTCCIAHYGTHPPNVCVGTPRWMAPEVAQAMHRRHEYGREVDIWSYGCLLLELLTLEIPFAGLSDSEIYNALEAKRRPQLTPELEAFSLSDEPATRRKMGITSDAQAHKLKLLVDIFYKCTMQCPADRPTAKQIFNRLRDAG